MASFPKRILIALFLLSLLFEGESLVLAAEIERLTLANGLTLVYSLRPVRPLVACQIWVKAGSADEVPEEAGVAHLLEHMIFKPTERYPEGVAPLVEGMGGTINASTSFDYTVYHFVVPSPGFPEAFMALAHSLLHPLFDPGELEKERAVVLEEMKMGRDDPQKSFYRRFWQEAFEGSPYGRPVIGEEETVRRLGPEDLRRFHQRHYRPQKLVVVIVGAVDRGEVLSLVQEAFGGLESKREEETPRRLPPKGYFPKVFSQKGGKKPLILLGFPVIGVGEKESMVLDLLCEVLTGGRTARLIRTLKEEKRLAVSLDASFTGIKAGGMVTIEAVVEEGKGSELIKAVGEELKAVLKGGLTDEEIERAKKALTTSFLYARETSEGEAGLLGYFEAFFGDARKVTKYLEELKALGKGEVLEALKEVLSSRATVGLLSPGGKEERFEEVAREVFSPLKRATLSNGIRVLFLEDHSLPLLAMTVAIPGGQRDESPQEAGLTSLLARCLTRGTSLRDSQGIAAQLEDIGAVLEGFSGRDSFGLTGKVPSGDFPSFLEVVAEILQGPAFSEEELAKAKMEQLAALKRQGEDLTAQTFQAFRSELFKGHPYGLNPLGDEKTIRAIGREDLLRYWMDHLDPSQIVIALVGDGSWSEVLPLLEGRLGVLQGRRGVKEGGPKVESRVFHKELVYGKGEQVHFVLGGIGPPLSSPDSYALQILASALQGQGGRLFKGVREERGLAYEVFFFYSPSVLAGYYGAYVATSPENLEEALEVVKGILEEVAAHGLSPEEVRRAKDYLLGLHERDLEGYSSLCQKIALYELYGLGGEYPFLYGERIGQVAPQVIQEVARRYLDPSRLALLVLKPS